MKRIIFFAIIVFLLLIIINLATSIVNLWSKKDLLTQTQHMLTQERADHAHLQAELQQVSTSSFIEKEARNKLFLVKPGEVVVLVPTASPSGTQNVLMEAKPNWQQWWELFF